MNYALIGGTGLEHFALTEQRVISVETPYGTVRPVIGKLGKQDLVFMSRHGQDHATPPHLVNYRGNSWALRELGVRKVVATAAVGSLSPQHRLGDLVLLDQFLDFTKSRPQTFFEGGQQGVLHVDMTEPYCATLRQDIIDASENLGLVVKNGACYVCTEGPRFETPAEIRMFQYLGAELVGMTSVPEVVLARELGMCYASISMVTNEAAGIADHPLNHAEVMRSIKELELNVARLVQATFELLTPGQKCLCASANAEVGKF
ncbi:S-methyl-5'-thioinosine phosphorylase [Desulfosporosinus sp.]|uniref:S-methyl-5'-thioinosine phosphorylase n=1 Tax=Desulfosporosinus sp. TaxID=157907 RepID=UPI0025C288E4|nr:S-methyl-5'-thioinosine phosphorylase [Desulfosporosinus sp.]MBC2721172.1 S-methyl-5'-thioinosine phosphorylase [Desulfosporosinus sp.]MBC2728232.1 S-methyl-5'-thioinosine phosphorylase [Desulfosporosinus sp.]